jgi:hypothetical protein
MSSVEIVRLLSGIVVVGFCLFLIGLAVVIATTPSLAERFLRSFASSAQAHYTEQRWRNRPPLPLCLLQRVAKNNCCKRRSIRYIDHLNRSEYMYITSRCR